MGLQVCEYPKCKTITLMTLCEEHRHEEFDDDEPEPRLPTTEEIKMRLPAMMNIVPKKETPMSTPTRICQEIVRTGTRCTTGCARGSDYCQRHLSKREGAVVTTTPAPTLPAKRTNASIVLSEPTHINPPAPVNGNGQAPRMLDLDGNILTVLDSAMESLAHDVTTLQAAKTVLQRMGAQ